MVIKKFFLAVLLINSERRLVSLTDSKHLCYELLAGCGGAPDRGGSGSLGDIRLERKLGGRGSQRGCRDGRHWQKKKNEI